MLSPMGAQLKTRFSDLRALLTGWLAVALLAPILLGFIPQPVYTPAELALRDVDAVLCSQGGSAAKQGQHQHSDHDRDCPCCLTGSVGLAYAPLAETTAWVEVILPRTFPAVAPEWTSPARHPHDYILAPQRGPPQIA